MGCPETAWGVCSDPGRGLRPRRGWLAPSPREAAVWWTRLFPWAPSQTLGHSSDPSGKVPCPEDELHAELVMAAAHSHQRRLLFSQRSDPGAHLLQLVADLHGVSAAQNQ
mmetsp:Transcript_24319/g.57973  ORF Transcript_24319/g.57973 Transcript_24319/m.57973 type:complete len:110 (+) Transcript_24319:680-1009(+)